MSNEIKNFKETVAKALECIDDQLCDIIPDMNSRHLMKLRELKNILKSDPIDTDQIRAQREVFNIWFRDLLRSSIDRPGEGPMGSCLLRDVVRKSKEELFKNWLELKPYGDL